MRDKSNRTAISQKSDEPAHVLSFCTELVLLEAMIFFLSPQCLSVKVVNSWADSLAA